MGRGKHAQLVPIRLIFTNKLTRDDKLLLAFDALVLSEALGCHVRLGKIVHGESHAVRTVNISPLLGAVRRYAKKVTALIASSAPADTSLNRHCVACDYQTRCRQAAIEIDDLSLLGGITENERKTLKSRGITTVTQLSYTFHPRRNSTRPSEKRAKHYHALHALAIREKKIHIVGRIDLKISGTPVYLDVEGVPDRNFYYLIGLRVKTAQEVVQHSLWADTPDDEQRIWRAFLGLLSGLARPFLVHYGSYETKFLKQMCDRYGCPPDGSPAAEALANSLNLLTVTFAHIYFPTHSNGLKARANFRGFQWSNPDASGAMSVVWRSEWEQSREAALKRELLNYNAEDCEALELLTELVARLSCLDSGLASPDAKAAVNVDLLPTSLPVRFGKVPFQIPDLEAVNLAAYWDYQRDKVLVRSSQLLKAVASRVHRS